MTESENHSFTNRLIHEKSPYLLQHAQNPVDWYPWGDEAFEVAKAADKPIFLSIGYATCHWCHVMEHESFENAEIAQLMNEAFICIKVDREERPDIDHIYMRVCQMMTGQGGWPLTIMMTPDKAPFHAATYVPPAQRHGRMGMKQLVQRISNVWNNQRKKVLESAGQITDVLTQQQGEGDGSELEPGLLEAGYHELMNQYDKPFGGFGLQPKFPSPHRLFFLLRQGKAEGVAAAEHTLSAMRKGGVFDQVGFGFHRYSTDRRWLLPHFEKMLYDQALLAMAYTEAYELTGKPFYKQVTEEILEYVMRDMTVPDEPSRHSGGAFYSAEDADSEGEEGRFYIWTAEEMKSVLGDDYHFVSKHWNVKDSGNFRDEASGQQRPENIPYLSEWLSDEDAVRISESRKKLFAVREKRIHPLKDTKVLADWNGLMIAALAKAGRAFGTEHYIRAAERAATFIAAEMQSEDGRLQHRWREGHTAVPGQLEDYAFMIFGLLELYDSTLDFQYLEKALNYQTILDEHFADDAGGGYFMTADDAEALIVRPKELYDGAIPSGNSVQLYNLLKLARLTGNPKLEQKALKTGAAFCGVIERSPSSFAQALTALQFAVGETVEVVVVGGKEEARPMIEYLHSVYQPGRVMLHKDADHADQLAVIAPFTKEQQMIDGKPTVYICRNFACEKPVNTLEELKGRITAMRRNPRRS
ncbi:thioredoxin domain-containing protein [Pontiella agarivorans]|uniref:Thioredoxin domain-containing protein n=1 Tax=Pontiella agarivorans TaxID=3038953 RepID=A0ABU5MW32_9BACT|nr:thioredoxin domain-containing protein [Pontiella agarivorans]MDZ8118420.1 thioredoxin domain-containing protein [Pontiella agarivorans]